MYAPQVFFIGAPQVFYVRLRCAQVFVRFFASKSTWVFVRWKPFHRTYTRWYYWAAMAQVRHRCLRNTVREAGVPQVRTCIRAMV